MQKGRGKKQQIYELFNPRQAVLWQLPSRKVHAWKESLVLHSHWLTKYGWYGRATAEMNEKTLLFTKTCDTIFYTFKRWLQFLFKLFLWKLTEGKVYPAEFRSNCFFWRKAGTLKKAMPVLGVASKLRQPPIGSKPIHTAHPIPNLGTSGSQQYPSKSLEFPRTDSSVLSCQLTLKSACDFGDVNTLQGKTKETEDSKVSSELYLLTWTFEVLTDLSMYSFCLILYGNENWMHNTYSKLEVPGGGEGMILSNICFCIPVFITSCQDSDKPSHEVRVVNSDSGNMTFGWCGVYFQKHCSHAHTYSQREVLLDFVTTANILGGFLCLSQSK